MKLRTLMKLRGEGSQGGPGVPGALGISTTLHSGCIDARCAWREESAMTEPQQGKPGQDDVGAADEQVEDLEAPAEEQQDVAGGYVCVPTIQDPGCGETK